MATFFLVWNETEYQAGMMMGAEQSVEYLAGESKVLGENLPQCRFVYHKSHMI
jgi:hypothetical protein